MLERRRREDPGDVPLSSREALLAKSAGKFAAPGRRFPWETNAHRISDRALFRKAARAVGGMQSYWEGVLWDPQGWDWCDP